MGVVAPCLWQSKNNDWNLGCEDWRFASWEGGYKHPKLHKNLSVFLGGGFKYFLFSTLLGEMVEFD